ncbi:osmoprotectant ABC transporter substrate-binding protein [Weissella minor]|uniref:Glycine betaine carnitine choline abc transporter, substrate binding protein n=1 Tax=Weissella minor TaxID=1620 RepID=A0A0R2JNI3_9LACO|nr:osmoprotectant ABC transporter substrate-binding protein [Weissella minor]KRN76039.1 glycine betaine carnitine choline abc transporter, substrate binding protein [Weissella minor]
MTKKKIKNILLGIIALVALGAGYFWLMPPETANKPITITGGITSEAQTLGSINADMIEHYTGRQTRVINNLATTTINQKAMTNNDAQVSAARYTGTDLTTTLGLPAEKDPKKAFDTVHDEFQKQYNETWFPSYGFENTYVFLVRKDTAKKYNLKTVSDMEKVADKLSLGVDTAWVTRKGDGYDGFKKTYFPFESIHPMQIGLVYTAVASKKMDVVLGYTTDGRINSYDLVMLKDDRQFFPPYDACPVVDNVTLSQTPKLREAMLKMQGKITTEQMQKLNYEVDNNLKEPSVVAREFLEKNNYFEGE